MAEKSEVVEVEEKIDFVEVLAPAGWKKFIPKKSETSKRNDILFISPTGEEIRSKKQLAQFLRSHPGGPSPSEFDWGLGDTPRRSTRLIEKAKAKESPEEGPPKKRERKSRSNKGTKQKKNDGDSEGEEEDEVPESKKADTQEAEGTVDAEMKDVEDSFLKEKTESAVITIEGESKAKVADQDSSESQEGKNKNELENLQPKDLSKDVPTASAPEARGEENSFSTENQEKLEVEEVPVLSVPEETSAGRQNQEGIAVEETYKHEQVLSAAEAIKEGNSAVSEDQEILGVEEVSKDAPVLKEHEESREDNSAVSENQEKLETRGSSNDIPEETKDENVVAARESPVDSEVSHKVSSIEKELHEKEVEDRTFLNDSFKWEQKKVPSS